jgi:hypothetical protein
LVLATAGSHAADRQATILSGLPVAKPNERFNFTVSPDRQTVHVLSWQAQEAEAPFAASGTPLRTINVSDPARPARMAQLLNWRTEWAA